MDSVAIGRSSGITSSSPYQIGREDRRFAASVRISSIPSRNAPWKAGITAQSAVAAKIAPERTKLRGNCFYDVQGIPPGTPTSNAQQIRGENRRFSAFVRISSIPFRNAPWKARIRAQAAVGEEIAPEWTKSRGKSFYNVLGIPQGSSASEIKSAYKKMARKYHPDVCPSPDRTKEYTRRFIEILEAYETLSDPILRNVYDRKLKGELNFAFSARQSNYGETGGDNSWWRSHWMEQLRGLKMRSRAKERYQEPFPE